jgi:hypothetical protein
MTGFAARCESVRCVRRREVHTAASIGHNELFAVIARLLFRLMAARTAVMAVGALAAAIAVDRAISPITGPTARVAVVLVLALAAGTAVRLTRGPVADTVRERRVRSRPATGIVDCAGQSLSIGDTVRAGAGFDGPMELGFGRGVVVKVGRGKAHVRFNDIPEQVHPITPGTLRRLA